MENTKYYRRVAVEHDDMVTCVYVSYVSKKEYVELFEDGCETYIPVMVATNRIIGKKDTYEQGDNYMYLTRMIVENKECKEPENVDIEFNGKGEDRTWYYFRIKADGQHNDIDEDEEELGYE